MVWHADQPYDDLPGLPPAGEIETRDVLKAVVEARAALARLDQAARSLPNPGVLVNAVPILEAQASSEIENIVTTADELFRLAETTSPDGDPSTREALRYRRALFAGVSAIHDRPLTARTAHEVCTVIKNRTMGVRALPGTRIANPGTGHIMYSPPEGTHVIEGKLSDWECFVHADDGLDPLVRMAIAHYQFEAIHPYIDGNGRTGRILNILMLLEAGLLSDPILYLSRYIIATKGEYYARLHAVTAEGEWEPWIRYMTEGVRATATSTVAKIGAIEALQDDVANRARAATHGGSNANLLSTLFTQPYCRISTVMQRCAVSRPTATSWLNALVDAGILVDRRVGRDRLFLNTEFLDLLVQDDFRTRPSAV